MCDGEEDAVVMAARWRSCPAGARHQAAALFVEAEAAACNGSRRRWPGYGRAWRESGRRHGRGQEEKHVRVAAVAELVWNIAPTNPLPHLASADSFFYLPVRRLMKIQASAVPDYAVRLHAEPCWALLFFFVGLTYALAASYMWDSACLYLREKIWREANFQSISGTQAKGSPSSGKEKSSLTKKWYASSIVVRRGCWRVTGGGCSRPVSAIKTDTRKAAVV